MVESIYFIAWFLLIWFETNAFVEYSTLIAKYWPALTNKLFLRDYEMVQEAGAISYPEFLTEYHNGFITRLLSCPICVSTQLGLFFSLFIGLNKFAVLGMSGLILYKLTKRLIS